MCSPTHYEIIHHLVLKNRPSIAKENYSSVSFMNVNTKILNKALENGEKYDNI